MLTRRLQTLLGFASCVLGSALVIAACDLNPQPLPPGDNGGNDAGALPPTGGQTSQDAASSLPPGADAGATVPIVGVDAGLVSDAGPASDGSASDGGADGPEDAPADGETDASPADASEDGG
jgi:hypothetical protein